MTTQTNMTDGRMEPQLALAVKRAQADTILDRLTTTLVVNAAVSLSAVLLSSINRGVTGSSLVWLLITMVTIAGRFLFARMLVQRQLPHLKPVLTLRVMVLGAFVSGLAWAALPFTLPGFEPLGVDGGIYILMCGMGTGAVLLGTGHAVTALAFAFPVHLSVIVSLLMDTSAGGRLLALNVLALTFVLYKSGVKGENIVIGNITAQLRATALASSLSQANADIMRANERLEILANGDPLTGLANRAAFNASLTEGIDNARNRREELALLILDLDRFKTINDTFGHSAGDDLLYQASGRLREAVGGRGVIARLGGDEFAIIIGGPRAGDDARSLAETILARGREPFVIQGRPVMSGVSIGIAIAPEHADTATDLFVSADMALYRAKDEGRGLWREFDHSLKDQAERRRRIEEDLPAALKAGDVRPWFQPQLDLAENRVVGFEALVRWRHAELGMIPPPEIVTAAHALNLSEALTETITATACRLLSDLPGLGLPEATVAVNISPREFELYSVADTLDRVTRAHGIDPGLFEIEITEEAIIDTLVAGEQLKHIERSGYKLAVDDFGAGHSSLAYLVSLKVDRLKLDRRFVEGIETSRQNQEIVGALAGLGRALSMDIVAEGVERAEEADTLRDLGCPAGQGYYFARPMPAEMIATWLEARALTPAA
ncbi:diguanylate cyclase (GGDEF) domain-containing protein [Rhizobium sp. NFR07]|uniref:putative bifunctional diguanylate cyclase/phosphodiesterase n=1 Tax=Rhizobium sp. NFR07 TaxID=1566262 RepID=UPI0008EFD7D5|nr:EAL domain-containing protein [Rhizobium sp. NFR07]SFB39839.1 diguanylate cyclase (GGDEF) domain-containing protein [Rhizobium sp. NFR07]